VIQIQDPVNPYPVNGSNEPGSYESGSRESRHPINTDPINTDPMNPDPGSILIRKKLNAEPQPCLDVHLEPANGLLVHAAGPAAHGVQVQGGFLHLHSSGFLFLFLRTLV
jgi:hypothetical protein